MDYNPDTLMLLAELTIAVVAFAVIVASLRITSGEKLDAFELMLIQFFAESGLMVFIVAVFPLVLLEFGLDEQLVAIISTWGALILLVPYFSYYFWRRSRIEAPANIPMIVSSVGWLLWVFVLGITLTGAFWVPSLAIITALVFWGLCSFVVVFLGYLANFVGRKI